MRRVLRLAGWILLLGTLVWGGMIPAWGESDHDLDYWQALDHTHYIQEGDQGRIVYLFIDPNCPYCHVVYDWAQNDIRQHLMRLRVVVVGFLDPSSAPKAAAILTATDPLAALKQNEAGFSLQAANGPEGGIAPANASAVAKVQDILQRNYNLLAGKESMLPSMAARQEILVPLLVYKDGDSMRYITGLPSNAQWLALSQGQ